MKKIFTSLALAVSSFTATMGQILINGDFTSNNGSNQFTSWTGQNIAKGTLNGDAIKLVKGTATTTVPGPCIAFSKAPIRCIEYGPSTTAYSLSASSALQTVSNLTVIPTKIKGKYTYQGNAATIDAAFITVNGTLNNQEINASIALSEATTATDFEILLTPKACTGFKGCTYPNNTLEIKLQSCSTCTVVNDPNYTTTFVVDDLALDPAFVAPPFVPKSIAEYNFDNTLNNNSGNAPFSSNNGVSFVNDRNGNANSAINIVNTGSTATITDLPYGAAARSVSLWAKLNNFSTTPYNMLYSYGIAGAGQVNGASFSATDVWHFGYNNNHQAPLLNALNTWHHFVFTYDGTNSKIYKNGVLVSTLDKTWNTKNNNNLFKLGVGVGGELTFDGAIDDLKIFNYALAQNDITSLYTNNVITSLEDNVEIESNAIYPNPVKDILHVTGSADIFDLVGNKVASGTTEINISHLQSGIYVAKATGKSQKIVKE